MAYGNAIFHPFVHDDVVYIQNNPQISEFQFREIFLNTISPSQDSEIVNTYYRPLIEIFTRLLYKIFGLNPHGFHFINILLHIANSIAVFILLRKLFHGREGICLTVALFFLLHPIQSEAVACISGISNVLFAFWTLWSFYFYLVARGNEKRPKGLYFLYSFVLFFFALLTKEQAIVLPFLVLLYEICFHWRKHQNMTKKIFPAAGYFLILLLYIQWRQVIVGVNLSELVSYSNETILRLLSIPGTLITYVSLLLFPHNLHYFRTTDILQPYLLSSITLSALTCAVVWIISVSPKEEKRFMVFGLGWFLITLLPTLNIIPLVIEYSRIFTFEHFLYFPLIGFFIFVIYAGLLILKKGSMEGLRKTGFITVGIISVLFLVLTNRQNTFWRGEIPLYKRAVGFEKGVGRLHLLLAKAYYFDRQYRKAISEYNLALNIMRDYAAKTLHEEAKRIYLGYIKEIHFDLAHSYEALNRIQSAVNEYHEAIAIDPVDTFLYNNRGAAYLKMGQRDKAQEDFLKAIELNDQNLIAKNNLAICYIEDGESKKAEDLLREILSVDKTNWSAQRNLERLLISGQNNTGLEN